MAEGNVAIVPDSTAPGVHNVRTVTVTPVTPVVVGQSEEQQVVTLADAQGNLYTLDGGQPRTSDQLTQDLLRGVLQRLDALCFWADNDYVPPDDLSDVDNI